MGIDSSIALQGRPVQFDSPIDMMSKAMTLKQLSNQGRAQEQQLQEAQTLKDIMKKNTVTTPDGKASLDKGAALSDLYKVNPQKAMEYQKIFETEDFDTLKRNTEAAKQLAWSATPETWGQTKAQAMKLGLPNAEKLPDVYSPKFHKDWQMATRSGEEQLAERWKQKEFALKQEELGIKRQTLQSKKATLDAKANKLTPTQAKQRGLYESGILAEQQFTAATSKKGIDSFDPTSNLQWIDKNDWAPNFLKSSESKEAHSAQDRWIEAFLRDASGAAIPPNERGAYAKDFFPVAGDSPQVVADKAKARQVKMQAAKFASGENVDFGQLSDEEIDLMYRAAGGE